MDRPSRRKIADLTAAWSSDDFASNAGKSLTVVDIGRSFGPSAPSRGSAMTGSGHHLTRRWTLMATAALLLSPTPSLATAEPSITVHKDPTCGCCSGWVAHLQKA